MLLVALRMPNITNFAFRVHPQHTENNLDPNNFKCIRPYSDYLGGTFLYMVVEVKYCTQIIKRHFV